MYKIVAKLANTNEKEYIWQIVCVLCSLPFAYINQLFRNVKGRIAVVPGQMTE